MLSCKLAAAAQDGEMGIAAGSSLNSSVSNAAAARKGNKVLGTLRTDAKSKIENKILVHSHPEHCVFPRFMKDIEKSEKMQRKTRKIIKGMELQNQNTCDFHDLIPLPRPKA